MGRPPVPTKLKLLRGNPGKRKLNTKEPQPPAVMPTCPRWLSREAKREWRRVCKELFQLGLLTRVDRAALAGYCEAWGMVREAEEILQDEGLTFTTESGYIQQRPEVSILHKSLQVMRAFLSDFGMSPAARSKVKAADPAEVDPFEDFLRGKA